MTSQEKAQAQGQSIFAPLRSRNFALVWSGQVISSVGNSMYIITLGWTVYQLTGSASVMGLMFMANAAPQFLLSIFGGAVGDRMSRRILVITSDSAAGLVTLVVAIAAWGHWLSVPLFIGASFALGVTSSFFLPAYSSLARDLVPKDDRRAANSLRTTASTGARVLGPILGALVYAWRGPTTGFLLDSVSFFVAVLTMCLAHVPDKPVVLESSVRAAAKDGLKYLWTTKWLRSIVILSLMLNTVGVAPFAVLLPLLIKQAGGTAKTLGAVMALQAIATASFALGIGKWGRRLTTLAGFYCLAVIFGVGIFVAGFGRLHVWLLAVAVVLIGAGFSVNVVEETLLQDGVAEDFLARVYGAATVASYALLPLGYALAGVIARSVGADWVLMASGAASCCVAALGAISSQRGANEHVFAEAESR